VFSLFILLVQFSHAAFLEPDAFLNDNKKIKALVFLSESCPCSRSHMQHLSELQKNYPQVSIYGVMTDRMAKSEDRQRIEKYYLSAEVKFPMIKDEQMKLVKLYGALKTPHVTLLTLGKDGAYEKVYEGGVSNDREFKSTSTKYLQENLEALLNEKKVIYKANHSLGCYIRRI
jgi:thiol-disulfide isomerase/thioredoxin